MKKVFHVISNTHWDREWRFPFQRNRQMLVDMIDKVIEILEHNSDYRAFHLDSQSIVVKDYLEIKPQNIERFKKLVNEKRLLIGPWYILPEEFQVGGENLIRNLLLGHKTCNEIGRVSKIGYSPFSWGQISQLPQIYKQFGINLIMFYRGINSIDSPKAEFLWEGADGSKMISSRFSTMPRYNFYFYIYRPAVHNEGFNDVAYTWQRGGTPFHFIDNQMNDEDFFIINPVDEYFHENIEPQTNLIIKDQADDFTTPHVIWMEGHDSSGPNEKTVKIIADIKKLFPNIEVHHSTLEEYADLLYKSLENQKLKLVKGERRSSQFDKRSTNLYGYTTSARMYLKQKNFEAEKWIQYYAEPFNSLSNLLGRDINDRYIEIAWELIVQNSAHDSIGGCSLDEIHDDMMSRYKNAIEISKGVFERSIKHIVKNIDTSLIQNGNGNKDIFITCFNPSTFERSEIVNLSVDVPKEFDLGSLEIINSKNEVQIINIIEKKPSQPVVEQMTDRPMFFDMIRYDILLDAKNIPALGYKTFKVIPSKMKRSTKNKIASQVRDNFIMENKYVKVVFNKNGTFNFTNKQLKFTQKGLGYFYDEGEAGHAWVNTPIAPFIDTLNSKPEIKIISNNELEAKISVTHVMKLPADLSARKKKKLRLIPCKIKMILTLHENSERIDLKIKLDNNVESHRLRIMFPTFPDGEFSFGEGQFDVVQRPIKRIDSTNWVEQPMYDYPMHHFVDVSGAEFGSAVIVKGLKEYEVKDDKEKTLAITLLRTFEFIIAPSSVQDYSHKKGSQCLGKNEFELAYFLHSGNWITGKVFEEAQKFNYEIRAVEHGSSNGYLPLSQSFLNIKNHNIIFSALKQSESKDGSFILRIYNPTSETQRSSIKFFKDIKKIEEVTLEEIFIRKIESDSTKEFFAKLSKKEIKTFKIYFKE